MSKKKIIILVVLCLLICIVIEVINLTRKKIETSTEVEMIKKNFPNINYVENVCIEWEESGGILPDPDGPTYRGYIYLNSEGVDYYLKKYNWENVVACCDLKKIDKEEFNSNTWMFSSEFIDECVPKWFWGNFYLSEKGIIYFEGSSY